MLYVPWVSAAREPSNVLVDVTATTSVQTLVSLSSLTGPAIAPAIAASLGVAPVLIGYMVSLVYGGAMITSLMGGTLVGRFGAGRISQLACVASALGLLLVATAQIGGVALGAIAIGLGYGLPNPAAAHILVKSGASKHRNLIFSIKQTGVPLGGVLAGVAAPRIATHASWRWAPVAFAAASLLSAAVLQVKRSQWDDDRDRTTRLGGDLFAGLRETWRHPALRSLSLVGFCYAAVQLCLTTFLVTMLVEVAGMSLVTAGGVLAVVQIAGASGRILWGFVADRLHDGLVVLIALGLVMIAGTVATALISSAWPTWLLYLVLAAYGATAVAWNGVYLAEVARLAPEGAASRATGASLFFTYGGVLFGPASFTLVHGAVDSYRITFALLSGAGLLGLVLAWRARRALPPRD